MTQLSLFDLFDQPIKRSAEIRAFPSEKMTGAIMHAADQVIAAGSSGRQELNRQAVLWRVRLIVLGLPSAEIDRSATRWRQEIVCELLRRSRRLGSFNEGDAA
ncbi:hypothetical protein [Aminobacter aminovorans]|uniref:hypothetical protein n=1 Tax=Aminobacter aminovorans TaxID=83263 RepID=UPI000E2066A7|nr:hypothetical protein [Aminobacter aminovorans]